MAAAAAAAAVVRGTGNLLPSSPAGASGACREGGGEGLPCWRRHWLVLLPPVGSTPSRTGGFLGTTSPGPMAELYGAANQDAGVSSYISAASPAPSTGFGHSLGVSEPVLGALTGGGLIHTQRTPSGVPFPSLATGVHRQPEVPFRGD